MLPRRSFLQGLVGGLLLGGVPPRALRAAELPAGTVAGGSLTALPGKAPLIKRAYRAPNFETPVEAFDRIFTPNDRFFVRWHLSQIPEIDVAGWRLEIGGESVERPYTLTLDELKRDFPQVEVAAVCQCSGNRRGFSEPHVPGVEWGSGAMGNARWQGVRLKDVLARAGIRGDALEVVFDGADHGVVEATPDFIKSLPLGKALDEDTLIAWQMNGEPLPHWNGFPARIVVPGWTATYWMKQVVSIRVVAAPEKGFWMSTAYRIPKGKFPVIDRFLSQEAAATTPITEMVVNSLIVQPTPGQRLPAAKPVVVRGIAWDGGYGIRSVEVSADGGRNWTAAELDEDYGRYSFRGWRHAFAAGGKGRRTIMARATNRQGATQTSELIFNPAGYHNNVMQRIDVELL